MSQKTKGTALTVLSAVIFGLSPMWAGVFRRGGGNPMLLTLFRNICFLPICIVMCRRAGRSPLPKLTKGRAPRLLLLALFSAGTQVLLFSSYRYMATGVCTTVHFVYPLLVFAIGAVVFHDRIDRRAAVCLVLCMIGLLCFYPRGEQISLTGFTLALCSGLTFASYMVMLEKGGFEDLLAPQLQFCCAAVGIVLCTVCCAVTGNLTLALQPGAWVVGIFAACLMCGGVLLLQYGVRFVGARKASLLSTFEPITSLVVGFTVMHEHLDVVAVLGACVILSSVLLFYAPVRTKA